MSTRPGRHATAQLDLFATAFTPEQQRDVDALTCLRNAVPGALEVVTELRYTRPTDTREPHANGAWAYCVCRKGLRFESRYEWGTGAMRRGEKCGWDRTPAGLITWDELAGLVGQDPRRTEVAAWVESLPMPRWRMLMRPHELWPDPSGWHIGYFCRDHVDAHWSGRRHAWRLVLDLLTDAIAAVGAA